MSTLYQLTEAYQELLSMALDPDTDPEALADTMEAIEGEFEDKADGYAKVMKEMKVFEDAKREEGKRQIDGANALKATSSISARATGISLFKICFMVPPPFHASAAPSFLQTYCAVREVPPVPRISTVLPLSSSPSFRISAVMPVWSVLSP